MGRSITPRYAFTIVTYLSRAGKVRHSGMIWRKHYGRPTVANLDKWVTAYEASCQTGGCNAHLGYDPVVSATIVDQYNDNAVVETWERSKVRPDEPKFQVIA